MTAFIGCLQPGPCPCESAAVLKIHVDGGNTGVFAWNPSRPIVI
jgi:hypothetical protein